MELKSSFMLDILKNRQNQYVFCIIKVEKRGMTFFHGQNGVHLTHRWLQPEHWAAFDSKLNELTAGKALKDLTRPLQLQLVGNVHVRITNTTIPIKILCKTVAGTDIKPDDVLTAIECKFEYLEQEFKTTAQRETNYSRQGNSHNDVTPRKKQTEHSSKNEHDRHVGQEDAYKDKIHAEVEKSHKERRQHDFDSFKSKDPFGETVRSHKKAHRNKHDKAERENVTPPKKTEKSIETSSRKRKSSKENLNRCVEPIKLFESSPKCFNKEKNDSKNADSSKCYTEEKKQKNSTNKTMDDISPSPHKKTAVKRTHKGPEKSVDKYYKFLESHDKQSVHTKRKKRTLRTYMLSDSSTESQENENVAKALTVSNRNIRKQNETEDSCQNSAQDQGSTKDKREKKSKVKISTTPKPLVHIPKKKNTDKESHCQENKSIKDWLSKSSSPAIKKNVNPCSTQSFNNSGIDDAQITETEVLSKASSSPNEKEVSLTATQTNQNDKEMELLKNITPKEPEKVEVLDLMKFTPNEILKTFDEYQSLLDELFKNFGSKPKNKWNNEVDHFFVMSLLSQTIQLEMMNRLSERYEKNMECSPKYGELFSMVLMPEWILRIFMKYYNMTREKAIRAIKTQNTYKALQSSIQLDEIQFDETLML